MRGISAAVPRRSDRLRARLSLPVAERRGAALKHPSLRAVLPLAFAAFGVCLARAIGHFALRDFPHVMDEIAYVLQARTFETGHLTAPLHLPRAAFARWFVDDRWATFSIFPPGWPAVLSAFDAMGLRAWANPLLHGVTALLVAASARRLAGERARWVAAAAYALCPQALVLAASLMSHTLVALCASMVTLGAIDAAIGKRRARTALITGAALGTLVLTRPLCAIVVASGLAAVLVWSLARHGSTRSLGGWCARAALPLIAACVLLGAYNRALTGRAARFAQSAYFDEHVAPLDDPQFHYRPGCNDLGFGPDHGCDYGIPNAAHDAKNALSNTGDNLYAWLLLAGGGPIVFFAAGLALVRTRRRALALSLAVPIAAAPFAYAFYWYAGTSYGARFYHSALPALIVLAACGLARLPRRAKWPAIIVASLALGWNAFATTSAARELSGAYWGTDDRFARVLADWKERDAVVMVAFRHDHVAARSSYFWTSFLHDATWRNSVRALSALALNGPHLDGPVVFAKFHPAFVEELRARFPARALWLYIVEDDGADRLTRFDATARTYSAASAAAPHDNFDGYVVDEP